MDTWSLVNTEVCIFGLFSLIIIFSENFSNEEKIKLLLLVTIILFFKVAISILIPTWVRILLLFF